MASIRLDHRDHALAVGFDHLAGIVGRAIIDDDDLYTCVGLRQRAVDRIRQEPAAIVIGNDDTDDDGRFPVPNRRAISPIFTSVRLARPLNRGWGRRAWSNIAQQGQTPCSCAHV